MIRVLIVIALLGMGTARSERLYSYVDDTGTKVLTNLGSKRGAVKMQDSGHEISPNNNYASLIQESAERHGIDADLVSAIIRVESAFDPRAVSHKNCKGLMQLHPDTATRFGVTDIFDPADNIEGGVKYLDFLMNAFDRKLDLVLAAYNAGENAVRRHNGVPPYTETVDYVRKVRSIFGRDLQNQAVSHRPAPIVRFVGQDGAIVLTNAPTEDLRITSSR